MSIEAIFYTLGALVAVAAVAVSFIGLKLKGFPSRRGTLGLVALFTAALVAVSGLAVAVARHEQQERLAEEAEAAREADESPEPTPSDDEQVVEEREQAAAEGPGGTLELAADVTDLAYDETDLRSGPGEITIDFDNPSPIPHDVVIRDDQGGDIAGTEIITEATDSVTVDLAPGEYQFYCSVPGHEEAGMVGSLTVE